MSDLIVYIDRSIVRDGRLTELKPAMAELTGFVEANEPEILAYTVYFNADEDRMTVMHMHVDQASLEFHMEVAGPKFPPIGEFIELESINVYGTIGKELEQRMREKASELGTGSVSIHELHEGFDHVTID